MDRIHRNGGTSATEPTVYVQKMKDFVAMSKQDQEMLVEFADITTTYEKKAQELKESGIPQRRAEIILELINATTPPRTYREVSAMLGMSGSRAFQIVRDARRRAARNGG